MMTPALSRLLVAIPLAAAPQLLANGLPPANQGVLALVAESGFNRFNVGLQVPFYRSDSDTSGLTGTISVRLDIDPATGRSPELTILDAAVSGTGISLTLTPILFGDNITASSTGFGGTAATIAPPGTIDPLTGQGDAAQHQFTINQGTVTGSALGNPIGIDFATDPASGAGAGTITTTIVPTATDTTRAYFDVTIVLPINLSEPIENELGLSATFSAVGTFKATGEVSVPLSDYLAWTEEQGVPGADPVELVPGTGLTNEFFWALGLDLADDPRPHLPQPDPAALRGFLLTLPDGGTGGPLVIESSTSLVAPVWQPVDPAELSPAVNPLPAGTTGTITVGPSTLPGRLLRLRVVP